MPPKRAPRRVAAVASDGDRQGSDPGSFQLPPYWEDRPELWFNQAEGLMRGRKITDPIYQAVLVQTALTRPQQEAVAHILELSPPPSDVFQQLKWKWKEIFFMLKYSKFLVFLAVIFVLKFS